MTLSRMILSLSSLVLLGLSTACSHEPPPLEDGQYWQRINASESIYLQGPKAQQMLNRDIAQCVVELRELERLGQIKDAIPTDYEGRVLGRDERELLDWDQPERDKYLFMEHNDYHDFESCMLAKGWERVMYVPYRTAIEGQRAYYQNNIHTRENFEDVVEQKTKPTPKRSNTNGPYSGLNN